MAMGTFIDIANCSCTIMLIISTIFYSSNLADQHSLQDNNRTCISSAAEPKLVSSSCYPLVNFTRSFCESYGIALPNYVYNTPRRQIKENDEMNKINDSLGRLGESKITRWLQTSITTYRKCMHLFITLKCQMNFPSCDRTSSVFREQKLCRETCLQVRHICRKLWDVIASYATTRRRDEKTKKFVKCELQPYRNSGDSPECWYYDFVNSTDAPKAPEWTTNADCLYLNGSSYHGNISVTAAGITCQSWTEQCPHRHTMNTTYPELNNAKNYCRNPKNSGQRPWCFTTDWNKRWEYCDIPKCSPVDGHYGKWSLKSACNVTCGEGFETWSRDCNNDEPKFGGRNCSHLGEPLEYRPCLMKPCPVNGGYSEWSLRIPCNVSCGEGVEFWRRACDNPEPKYGGRDCSELGNSSVLTKCKRKRCPVDGNYSNWTKSLPCSVTCGQGIEVWTRQCDNPPGKYGGNCSIWGTDNEARICVTKPCPVVIDSRTTAFMVTAGVIVLAVLVIVWIFLRRNHKESHSSYSAVTEITDIRASRQSQNESSSRETGTIVRYENLTADGNPFPGLSRGVASCSGDYVNTRPSRYSRYDRLQLFRSLAAQCLRNVWGSVDEQGGHVYDVLQRNVGQVFVSYDKIGNIVMEGFDKRKTSSSADDTLETSSAAMIAAGTENAPTTAIV
ncbi:A disintegrin and metalloproteinase with thrombospondin motifs adt-1-like [Dendronephthya gigantea]|uniref:A disintegrin and metalloproteinase with thrombospondin motifs adt-1-like n=1 Tax=Dendronephthya gigantea TaxID=151771 RepID=UPI00106B18BF|nr:A disintegrin and metalloproteinase with thrombospondin motifs adt-1-like [Dendronephthya gigantea]